MSFGLARDRELSDSGIGITNAELPPLPDSIISDREAGRIDPRCWFIEPALPLEIEIGVGKGTFLVNQVPANRKTNFLGIEWAHEFYLYAADRLRRRAQTEGLTNIRLLHGNGVDFLKWRCPGNTVRVIHLYFSDPWPKKKHHKNRVIHDAFLAEVWRVLIASGELRIVTDHDESWAWNVQHFSRWTSTDPRTELGVPRGMLAGLQSPAPFEQLPFAPPEWVGDGEIVGTNYERKFRRDDRPPHATVLRKLT
jgi:tRNA (guanine-N7-)-methyltransferase